MNINLLTAIADYVFCAYVLFLHILALEVDIKY